MLAQVLLTSFNGDTINIIVHCHHSDSQQDPDNDSDASETNRLRRCYTIQLWFLELHDSPLELKGELQYLDENCHFRGEKMTILV